MGAKRPSSIRHAPDADQTEMGGNVSTREERIEIIVREHIIERDGRSTKSRRYDIYKRVFQRAKSDQVIASVEKVLNGK